MRLSVEALARPEILAMKAYRVPDALGYIKLDAMENPWELSALQLSELGRQLAGAPINRYPDPRSDQLKDRLRDSARIPLEAAILLGNGSDEIITLITQALARPDAVVLAVEPSFVMYQTNALFSHMRYIGVPLHSDFSLDLPAMREAIARHKPAVIFIAYPNNPTGNCFAREDIMAIMDVAPGLVVIDEAYSPFSNDSFMRFAGKVKNLLVMRTLSKMGLAGIRLGFVAGESAWIDVLDKVRPPYNINVLTQIAASFALTQGADYAQQAALLREARTGLSTALEQVPGVIRVYPSEANFITLRVDDAQGMFDGLRDRRILIKNLHGSHPLLDHCLRITVGLPEENQAVIDALNEYAQT